MCACAEAGTSITGQQNALGSRLKKAWDRDALPRVQGTSRQNTDALGVGIANDVGGAPDSLPTHTKTFQSCVSRKLHFAQSRAKLSSRLPGLSSTLSLQKRSFASPEFQPSYNMRCYSYLDVDQCIVGHNLIAK
jgi:hypothetical protein